MKKRPRRTKRPPPGKRRRAAPPAEQRALQYKVVELSTVDEGALERTLNEWVPKGWRLENVQFAMRESSKRPSMAFVFFTREGFASAHDPAHHEDEARRRLERLAYDAGDVTPAAVAVDPHQRLRQLAGIDGLSEEPL